jgi:type III restriction enzyme
MTSGRHVGSIAGRLSLRTPQRRSLEILDRVMEISPPQDEAQRSSALSLIRGEFPTVEDFERAFPSRTRSARFRSALMCPMCPRRR